MKTESGREIFWATDVFSRDGETCRFVMDSGGPSLIIGSSKVAKSELPSVEEEQVAVLEEERRGLPTDSWLSSASFSSCVAAAAAEVKKRRRWHAKPPEKVSLSHHGVLRGPYQAADTPRMPTEPPPLEFSLLMSTL